MTFTQQQAQDLAQEIRSSFPSLPIRVTHLSEEDGYEEEQNMVAVTDNDHAIAVFQSCESWQGFLNLARIIAKQDIDNVLEASLNRQAQELGL